MKGQRVDTGLFVAALGTACAVLAVHDDGRSFETTFNLNNAVEQIPPVAYAQILRQVADELDELGDSW